MATTDATAIRARMARIRSRAQGKAVRLGQETKQFLDWKHYVRLYPWGVVGVAAVVGYLLVPARRPAPMEWTGPATPPVEPLRMPPPPVPRQPGLLSSLTRLAMNAALRSAVAYAGQAIGQSLVQMQQAAETPTYKDQPDHDTYSHH